MFLCDHDILFPLSPFFFLITIELPDLLLDDGLLHFGYDLGRNRGHFDEFLEKWNKKEKEREKKRKR